MRTQQTVATPRRRMPPAVQRAHLKNLAPSHPPAFRVADLPGPRVVASTGVYVCLTCEVTYPAYLLDGARCTYCPECGGRGSHAPASVPRW